MTTIQTYECPEHGLFEVVVTGEVPDEVLCEAWLEPGPEVRRHWASYSLCHMPAEWRPSAPPVHTPDTRRRALVGHARDTNPW